MSQQRKEAPHGWYGYVYLLRCGDQYKIGYSLTPRKRLKQFRTGSPHPILLIYTLRTSFYEMIEKQLHSKFRHKRGLGEWFALTGEDVEYIKSLNNQGYAPEEQAARDRRDAEWKAKQDAVNDAAETASLNVLLNGFAAGAGEFTWV